MRTKLFLFGLAAVCLSAAAQPFTMNDPAFMAQQKPASGTWLPSNEASLVAWYKADVGVTNTSGTPATDGQSVTGWQDNSSHAHWATNWEGGSTYCTFVANQQNGLPAVRFNGAGSYLRSDDIYTSYLSGDDVPVIWAMAYRLNLISHASIWFDGIAAGGTPARLRAEIDGSNRFYCTRDDGSGDNSVFVDWPVDISNWHVVVWVFTGTTAQWFQDSVSQGAAQTLNTGALKNNASDYFFIGRDYSASPYFAGDIGEILLFNSASVDRTSIETYLRGRWNTPLDTPDTCTTLVYQNATAQDDFTTPSGGNTYFGVLNYSPASTVTVCSFSLDTILASGVQYRGSIWTVDGSGNLLAQQGGGQWSEVITGSDVRKTFKFNFAAGMSLSSGVNYALAVSRVTGTIAGTENIYQGGTSSSFDTGVWNGSGTLTGSSTRDPRFAVYQ